METIFEFILELLLEGSIEISKSRIIPKYIRYPLIGLLSLFFLAVLGLIFVAGILVLKESLLGGIFLILLGVFLLVMAVLKLRKTYLARKPQV